jgi:gamma-glutamyltranspeptidase
VLAFPPNSQGVALLMQMNMAAMFDLPSFGHNEGEYIHSLVEIRKLAFAERDRYVSDPSFAEVPLDQMLSARRARELLSTWSIAPPPPRTQPNGSSTGEAAPGTPATPAAHDSAGDEYPGDGDTVFLGVVDADGNAVALIQSLYNAFGSGRMVPGTGIVMHNRGAHFSLDVGHVNVVAPRKRTYHTLAPSMVLNGDGSLFMVLGTPGSDGQTQTLLQVFNNIVLFGMTAQRAVEAPRWRSWDDGRLQVEEGISERARQRLLAFGHSLRIQEGMSAELGGAQVILVTPAGVRAVGADPRREAYGIAW